MFSGFVVLHASPFALLPMADQVGVERFSRQLDPAFQESKADARENRLWNAAQEKRPSHRTRRLAAKLPKMGCAP